MSIAEPPISDVPVGIQRVYGLHKQNKIFVFDTCERYKGEKGSYSRKINKATGEVTDEIKDKNSFHMMDAERYIVSYLNRKHKEVDWSTVDGLGQIDEDEFEKLWS
jgi:stalled ribosome alternative rescue factor ArfA